MKQLPWKSERIIYKQWQLGRWDVRFSMKSTESLMGRFGGGWNWKLGFQAGGSTIIFSLLVAELIISRKSS